MSWQIGPFRKQNAWNPVLEQRPDTAWTCPLAGEVRWEAKDVFNPAAVVRDGQIHLLYRAEDTVGTHRGTSRIGLAKSSDGLQFEREDAPILFPLDDLFKEWEWEGGCEDPRVVQTPDRQYVMTYTAFDGVKARLCVATSPDLRTWTKHGLAFPHSPNVWSKAGSVVCRVSDGQLVATRINGRFWMYWGESNIFMATSEDLIRWTPVLNVEGGPPAGPDDMPMAPVIASAMPVGEIGVSFSEREALVACMRPRSGRFDSALIEPGPPAILTDAGIVLLYHGKNSALDGDPALPDATYCVGQALFDPTCPTALIGRCTEPFLRPEEEYELVGQVGNVCFAEGLVPFDNQWWLYYGTADSRIAVATAPMSTQPA